MNKFLVGLLVTGCIALAAGGTIVGISIANGSFVESDKTVTNEHVLEGNFENIYIDVETANITINKATDGVNKVVCTEREDGPHTVKIENNYLNITYTDNLKWYLKMFNFSFSKIKVDIYLTNDSYNDIKSETSTGNFKIEKGFTFSSIDTETNTGSIKLYSTCTGNIKASSDTGSIEIENIDAKGLEAASDTGAIKIKNVNIDEAIVCENSTGKVSLTSVNCKSLRVDTSTGDITLKDTISSSFINANASTGDIELDKADAETLSLNTSTGSISGTLLTEKIFVCTSSTGKINHPNSTTGGVCTASTSTGSINLSIA